MAGQYRDTDFLWKEEYFREASQWQDYSNIKIRHAASSNRDRQRTIPEEVPGRGRLVNHGEPCVWKQNKIYQQRSSQDTAALLALLKACAKQKDLCKGSRIHREICKTEMLSRNVFVGTGLLNMYAKCGALAKAQELFDELPIRNVVSWNALISGYVQYGHPHEALSTFQQMQQQGLSPDAVTFACILKACACVGAVEQGEEIYAEVVKQGLPQKNMILGTALVDMYAKSGVLVKAQAVFDGLLVQDVVSWGALIAGYAQHGHGLEALNCFEKMRQQGLSPDAITFTCVLKACGSLGAIQKGEEIHAEVVRQGLLNKDTILGTALVDMYAKCGALAKAQEAFDELPGRHVVSWNALIGGYAQYGDAHEVLKYFEQMEQQGFSPDPVAFNCILKACGSMGAVQKGEEIHAEIVRQGLLENNIVLGTALVGMYAKCGSLTKAQEVFDELPVHDVVSWNAVIAGYAQLGDVETLTNLFNKMIGEGTQPDLVTFHILLSACSHAGLVDKGQMYFMNMSTSYGVDPTPDHFMCMVDLLGRAGHCDKAIQVIEKLQPSESSDYLPLWFALLGACRKWGNVKLGNLAFKHALQLDVTDAAAYAMMSNIFATAITREEASKVEAV